MHPASCAMLVVNEAPSLPNVGMNAKFKRIFMIAIDMETSEIYLVNLSFVRGNVNICRMPEIRSPITRYGISTAESK